PVARERTELQSRASSAPEGRRTVATGGATPKAERNPWKGPQIHCPPRRGGGWLPRVERAQRAQPVECGVNMDSAPEGRRLVATGGANPKGERSPWESGALD